MTDRTLDKIRAAAIVALLVCMAHAFGCASAPTVIPAVEQLRQIADDPEIKSLPEAQRVAVVKAIEQAQSEVIHAQRSEQKESGWAEFGRRVAFALGGALAAIFAFVALRIFRR